MCSDHKKNLYIERNKQLLRMAHEDMHLFKKLLNKLLPGSEPENGEDNGMGLDEDMAGQETVGSAQMYQRYTRIDQNTMDYLNSEHTMAMQNSRYV